MKNISVLIVTSLMLFSFISNQGYSSDNYIVTGAANRGYQKTQVINRSFDGVFQAKTFRTALVDKDNTKWFLTEIGIVSFDGKTWSLHNKNSKVPTENVKDLAYNFYSAVPEVLIATPNGATVASLPINEKTDATIYNTDNTTILSNNVVRVTAGINDICWFGTDKGVSAFRNNKWLTNSYDEVYPGIIFQEYPITSMGTSPGGDTLYVGTEGAGVARIFRDDVDGISGASVYAQWGPIILPSDKIYSILIASDSARWFGTDAGVAKHTGDNTLDNWTVFTTDEGLVDNFVQAIAEDSKGKLWFGTKGGVSVFDGTAWTSLKMEDGLSSNNILSIAVDKNGIIWLGTDNGVMSYNNGEFVSYK